MKTIKRMVSLVVVVLLVFTVVACSKQDTPADPEKTEGDASKILVGFSQMDHSGPWRVTQTDSMVTTARERGFKLVYTDAQEQTSKQLSDIEDLVAQGVNYLVIAPRETTGLERGLEAAKKANIPVILIDRDHEGIAGEDYVTFVASDFIFQGYTCGKALADALGGKGNVVVIEGQIGGSDARDRQAGFEQAMDEYPDIQIIAQQPGDYSRSKAQSVMENFLQSHGDEIDAVFCHDDEMAMGAITAVEAAGKAPGKDIKIAGIDGQKVAIQAIIDGKMTCVVTCSPHFGPTVFDIIEELIAGEKIDTHIQLEDKVITADNAKEELQYGF